MIDPEKRWSHLADGKPDYAGLLTFAGLPYTEDPGELAGFDVAIIGAPMDELVSDRPGTRFGPRAIRSASAPGGPHLEAGVDAFTALEDRGLRRRGRRARRPGRLSAPSATSPPPSPRPG